MGRRNHIWVVEWKRQKWWPMNGASLTRKDALFVMAYTQNRMPDDTFRVTKYIPAPSAPGKE